MFSERVTPSLLWVLLMLLAGAITLALLHDLPLGTRQEASFLDDISQSVPLPSEGGLEQSFLPLTDGLSEVTVRLSNPPGEVVLTLLDEQGNVVASGRVAATAEQPRATLSVAPQPSSSNQGYRLRVESATPGVVLVLAEAGGDAYAGHLRANGERLPGDLALAWHYRTTARHLLGHAAWAVRAYGGALALTLLLWLLPGWWLLAWVRRAEAPEAPWSLGRLVVGSGVIGAALLVLLPLWTTLLGISLGPWAVWLLIGLSALGLLWARGRGWPLLPTIRPDGISLHYGIVVALLVASRLAPLHGLPAALWGDGVHHSLITEMILVQGGVPDNYLPFVPLTSFTYHVGFHLLCGWMAWSVPPGVEALTATEAVLLGSQWINLWAVLVVGLLAESLCIRAGRPELGRRANVVALVFAGLVMTNPGFFTNWGRFTQLGGHLFLPPALAWTLWLRADRPRRWLPLLLALAALSITHYRVAMMVAVALPVLVAWWLWRWRGAWRSQLPALLGQALLAGALTLLLVMPWFLTLATGTLDEQVAATVAASRQPTRGLLEYALPGNPWLYYPIWLFVLSGLAVLWLLAKRQAAAWLMAGVMVTWYLLSNPYYFLRLPGTGLVNNFTIDIALYIPFAVVIGIAAASAWQLSRGQLPQRMVGVLGGVMLLLIALPGLWLQVSQIDAPGSALQTRYDQEAARWIATETPDNATIHINGFPAFSDSVIVGSDGGWWLWQEAQRETTVPPIIYDKEQSAEPGYGNRVEAQHEVLRAAAQQSPEALAEALRRYDINYVYIGARQGSMNTPAAYPPLDGQALLASDTFDLVYDNDFVQLFQVR